MLFYPNKIDWRRLTNVCYDLFMGSETLETYIQTVVWDLCAWARQIYIILSACLSVCLCDILPLASDLYKIGHCLGLKHNFFRQRCPQFKINQIGQHKENMWWQLWSTLVTQVVRDFVQCSKSTKIWLYVCLSSITLLSFLLKTWLFSLITTFYMQSEDRAFLWKL